MTNSKFFNLLDLIDSHIQRKKEYFLSHGIQLSWIHAHVYCRSHGLNLASLNSEHEKSYFLGISSRNFEKGVPANVGGVFIDQDWFWMSSGSQLTIQLNLTAENDNRNCLQAVFDYDHEVKFKRTHCFDEKSTFVCERII